MANEYRISITIDGKDGASGTFGNVQKGLDGIKEAADRSDKGVGGFFSNMLSTAGGIITSNLIGGIANQFTGFITGAIGDAREANMVMGQSEAVIKSTGGAAGVEAQHVADYAASLSAASGKSLFGDSQIQEAENLLLTFTNIKGEMLDEATSMSVDMAQALGGDPKAQAIALGKALNDPIQGVTALSRVGVTFTDEQKQQIKTLQDSGNMMGAQKIILNELSKEFGGSAESAAKADGGVAQFKDRLGEAGETMGAAVLPMLNELFGFLNTSVMPVVETLAQQAVPAFVGAWEALQPAIQTVANLWSTTLSPALEQVWTFIQANLTPILYGLAAALVTIVVPAFVAWAAGAAAAAAATIVALAPVLVPIAVIGVAVALLKAAWDSNFLGIRTALTNFWNNYGLPIFNTLKEWLANNIPVAIRVLTDFWNNTLMPAIKIVWNFVKNQLIPIFTTIAVDTFNTVRTSIQSLSDFWNNILLPAVKAVWGFLDTYIIPIFRAVANVEIAALKLALRSLADFWSNTLKPAINAVWSFLDTYVIPLFKALVNVHIAAMKLAVRELAELWKNTLKPALDAVWGFIDRNINPIFKTLSDTTIGGVKTASTSLSGIWNDTLKPALNTVADVINTVAKPAFDTLKGIADTVGSAISGIGDAIKDVIDWLNDLADKINNLPSIPDVPGFAGGTSFAPGGMALVGERGPELVRLARGAQVFSNSRTERALAGGGERHYHLHINTTSDGVGSLTQEFAFLEAFAVS